MRCAESRLVVQHAIDDSVGLVAGFLDFVLISGEEVWGLRCKKRQQLFGGRINQALAADDDCRDGFVSVCMVANCRSSVRVVPDVVLDSFDGEFVQAAAQGCAEAAARTPVQVDVVGYRSGACTAEVWRVHGAKLTTETLRRSGEITSFSVIHLNETAGRLIR